MKLEKAIEKLREIQDRCRYCTYIQNGEREEWKREYQAIEVVLKELEDSKDTDIELYKKLNMQERVIDEMAGMINTHNFDDICKEFGKYENCSNYIKEGLCEKCIKDYFYKKVEEQEK